MAKWADVEFRNTPKYRRVQDIVSLAVDLLMLWDFFASVVCGLIASTLLRGGVSALGSADENDVTLLPKVVIGSLALALTFRSATCFDQCVSVSSKNSFVRGPSQVSRVILASLAVAVAVQIGHQSAQIWIVAWLLSLAVIFALTRRGLTIWFTRLEKSGSLREAVAIIGASGARERLAARISSEANIVGFYQAPSDQMRLLYADEIKKLQEMGADGYMDSVVVAVETEPAPDISQIVERLKVLPVQLAICDEGEGARPATAEFRCLAGVPVRVVAKRPIKRRDFLIKSALDKIGAIILLVLLSPFMVIIAVSIAATSRGPVIFRQIRQGWCGRQFTVLKFRTMQDAPDAFTAYKQTKRNDPRCTRVGRILRSTSLDELPQLWNVIVGEMSLVGPRPHADIRYEDDQSGCEIIAEYAQRYRVRPGITGWAQIHGARGATTTIEQLRRRVALDLYYIEHWSLWLDLTILARTPFCMTGKNAF